MMRTRGRTRRAGVTMIELLVVLAILGVIGGIVGFGFRSAAPPAPGSLDEAWGAIATARRQSVREGRAIVAVVRLRDEGSARITIHHVTALPDGSVVADSALDVARLSGTRAVAGTSPGSEQLQ